MKIPTALRIGIALALPTIPNATSAATFCVGTTGELQAALAAAENNGANDVIRIKTGTYTYAIPFVSVAFFYETAENFDITLEGGWSGLGATCTRRLRDPTATVLSGSGSSAVLWLTGANGTAGDIVVEQLTVRNGNSNAAGAGMLLGGDIGAAGFNGDIVVERVYFDDNTTTIDAAGLFVRTNGGIRVRNSVFRSNSCDANACAASIRSYTLNSPAIRTVFSNNTIFGNVCNSGAPSTCVTGGIFIGGLLNNTFMPNSSLLNNAFALNDGNDVELQVGSHVDVLYNNINLLAGTPESSAGNLNVINPHFVSILDHDFRLQPTSPLRNAGYDGFLIGLPPYSATDYAGIPRVQENRIDIGAHEFSEIIFQDGFE